MASETKRAGRAFARRCSRPSAASSKQLGDSRVASALSATGALVTILTVATEQIAAEGFAGPPRRPRARPGAAPNEGGGDPAPSAAGEGSLSPRDNQSRAQGVACSVTCMRRDLNSSTDSADKGLSTYLSSPAATNQPAMEAWPATAGMAPSGPSVLPQLSSRGIKGAFEGRRGAAQDGIHPLAIWRSAARCFSPNGA